MPDAQERMDERVNNIENITKRMCDKLDGTSGRMEITFSSIINKIDVGTKELCNKINTRNKWFKAYVIGVSLSIAIITIAHIYITP